LSRAAERYRCVLRRDSLITNRDATLLEGVEFRVKSRVFHGHTQPQVSCTILIIEAAQRGAIIDRGFAHRIERHQELLTQHQALGASDHQIPPRLQQPSDRIENAIHQAPNAVTQIAWPEQRLNQIRPGTVTITATCDTETGVTIRVCDTGIGIAEKNMAEAFSLFGQIDSALSRKFECTGLGLPLSRSLAQLYDGNLTLESKLSEGTCAILTLPAECVIAS